MTLLAPLITGYLRDYMPRQRGYSPHSCETYAYGFRLLLTFAAKRSGTKPSQLHVEQFGAKLILDFLAHIEGERRNGASTRNLRLAAIKSFMRYVEYRVMRQMLRRASESAIGRCCICALRPACGSRNWLVYHWKIYRCEGRQAF